jgi:hypothetical protein
MIEGLSPRDYERWAEKRCAWVQQWNEIGGTISAQVDDKGKICAVQVYPPDRTTLDAKQRYWLLCLERQYDWQDVAFALSWRGLAAFPVEGMGMAQ